MTTPALLATMPATELDVRYRMGPLFTEDANDFWWNGHHDDGTATCRRRHMRNAADRATSPSH